MSANDYHDLLHRLDFAQAVVDSLRTDLRERQRKAGLLPPRSPEPPPAPRLRVLDPDDDQISA